MASFNLKAFLAMIFVFVGCCSNVVFLELIIKIDPGAGNLITFLQFLFIAVEGLVFTSKFFTVRPKISMRDYVMLVVLFFGANVCNNYAFNFNIPMPLHMIFRSGSLMANMIMGIILLKKRYNLRQYSSVAMITGGIILCTLMSSTDVKDNTHHSLKVETSYSDFFWWCVGIALLAIALLVTAYMGIYQEVIFKRHGKHPNEALFYTHMLPLPGFLVMASNIAQHWSIAVNSEAMSIPLPGTSWSLSFPLMFVYLLFNVITQYICIASVYVLTTECASLTVTLVVTLRKFVSLLFSIMYFRNPFTISHWLGTVLVFFGTILFADVLNQLMDAFKKRIQRRHDSPLPTSVEYSRL
ncbi:UDP-xylose and UDP-N-acetylglucosamine transporter-like [Drosophila nasuta]|uniref:UDP-xylose and UDP-N-acetylglucosamine transporter-like n=1 Tax=Drosophila albomicans TaxID=7291 RepID=A0A9C6TD63_DROAB|nr:UDP-xylose and UDP-N-acetylglucosamine transporter-like [Drosophila albomicans]XP_051864298.1 UDP-xylose and UDP-N-acetylglucosamine transporter-like [Drosophila albomicans]XP_051864300.1 UDP-xylose and UDP-N-acetylglucosamine transporter-like [Drosophila albomicans]XP_051864301.1 UDP-xylose and UDP-N-acetylglucosamine transporter-like [Drosophila albomicans]XP_051864302.1 UDP-xylose and UDP-N-acetylglucosamine transporter-like [Drosophila albomicans]XP_060664358.1 UDP-xylose and UDP-N-acet